MDEDEQLRALLVRVADAAGPFPAPPIEALIQGRRRHVRSPRLLTALAAAAAIVALAVGLAVTSADRNGGTSTPPATTAPAPIPAVTVAQLKSYRWSALPTAPIPERTGAASAWTGQAMIVWGGQTADKRVRNDGASYNPTSKKWTTLPAAPLSGRAQAHAVYVNGFVIVWGGYGTDSLHPLADGARYNTDTGAWTALPPAPVASYTQSQLVAAGNVAVLVTTDQGDPASVRASTYDSMTDHWTSMPKLASPTGHQVGGATVLAAGGSVYVWSNWSHTTEISKGSYSIEAGADPYVLDVAAKKWSSAPLKPDPGSAARQPVWADTLVLLPDEDIYCGPCSHPITFNNRPGVAINPGTGVRRPISSGPLNQYDFIGYYWTGSVMLALDLGTATTTSAKPTTHADAAAWDPVTSAWTRLPGAAPHGGTDEGVIVWAGDRLLVWGITASGGSPVPFGQQYAPPGS